MFTINSSSLYLKCHRMENYRTTSRFLLFYIALDILLSHQTDLKSLQWLLSKISRSWISSNNILLKVPTSQTYNFTTGLILCFFPNRDLNLYFTLYTFYIYFYDSMGCLSVNKIQNCPNLFEVYANYYYVYSCCRLYILFILVSHFSLSTELSNTFWKW